jgi:hypothetical protein
MSVRNTVSFTRLAAVHPLARKAMPRLRNTCAVWTAKSPLHIGLILRIPRTEEQQKDDLRILQFGLVFEKMEEVGTAVTQAKKPGACSATSSPAKSATRPRSRRPISR